ncbi:MAG: response regulator [Nitrospirae bacterium]|nr:response regulator [Nitrospirota bacterium]
MDYFEDTAIEEKSLAARILPLLVIVFASLFLITVIVFFVHQKIELKQDVSLKLRSSERILNEDTIKDANLIEGLTEPIINKKELETALINKDRDALKQAGLPLFNHLSAKYNITHFTFIDPECMNIIRLHDLELYGEKVTRFTCNEAVKTGKSAFGLELGALGTFTLRVVTPWYYKDKLIGYLELGMDINHIVQRIKQTLEVEPYVLIEKSMLKQQGWESGMKMLGYKSDWNMFTNYVINNASVNSIPESIKRIFSNDNFKRKKIYLVESSNSDKHNIGYFPLTDASGKKVGFMVISDLYTHRIKDDIKAFSLAIVISLLIVLLILWVFYKVLSTIDKRLRDYNNQRKLYEIKLNEAKDEAKASDRAKTEFLSNMSHEIRTPLNGIVGTLELLLDTTLNDEQKELLLIAANSAESLQLLMDSILDIVDMTSGKVSALKKKFNIRDLIRNISDVFSIKAKQKGLKFSYTISDDVPKDLFSIPELIKQALTHLTDNAIKFTDSGEVQLIIKRHNESALIFSIIDTGIGIPKDKFDDIFKSFVQVDMSLARKYGGAGLGLAITQKIINILEGKLWVESEQGIGSRFNFIINTTNLVKENSRLIENGVLKDKSVLIVDDDIINRAILREILNSEGAATLDVSNGKEALEIIREKKFPLNTLIMETRLDDINTSEFIRILKDDNEFKYIKIILMSTDNVINLEEFKAFSLLEKPINKSMLINSLIKPED